MKEPIMKNMRLTLQLGVSATAIAILAACGGGGEGGRDGGGGGATMPVTTGLLQSLTITPATSSVVACSAVQYAATASYSDGTILDVTNTLQWAIDPASSSVAIANASNGKVMGINAGSATINAWAGRVATSAVLNVSAGNALTAINVTPASATVAVAATQAYTATATCTVGTVDISTMNIWSSGSASVANISTAGLATGVAAGSSVVSATAGGIAASAVLNVQ